MKVLVKVQLPQERVHRVRCQNCKSELEFLEKEARRHFDQRDGDYIEVTCPVCGARVTKGLK